MSGTNQNPNTFDDMLRQQADTFNDVLREYARAKIQQTDIHNYAGANLAYNHAANIANSLNLSESQKLGVTPFPASPRINISSSSPEQQEAAPQSPDNSSDEGVEEADANGRGKAMTWLVPALSALGGAGGLGAVLLSVSGWIPRTEDNQGVVPTSNDVHKVTDEHYDPEVGLEVEGIPGGWPTKTP